MKTISSKSKFIREDILDNEKLLKNEINIGGGENKYLMRFLTRSSDVLDISSSYLYKYIKSLFYILGIKPFEARGKIIEHEVRKAATEMTYNRIKLICGSIRDSLYCNRSPITQESINEVIERFRFMDTYDISDKTKDET